MKKKTYNTPHIYIARIHAPRILAGSETIQVDPTTPIESPSDIGAKGTSMDFWGNENFDE